jgi:hypothetical protein
VPLVHAEVGVEAVGDGVPRGGTVKRNIYKRSRPPALRLRSQSPEPPKGNPPRDMYRTPV